MNNIELERLKKDIMKFMKDKVKAESVGSMKDDKLHKLKKELERLKAKSGKSTRSI